MNHRLAVYLHGRRAGTLALKENGNLQFRYDDQYVAAGSPAISHAMPLGSEAIPHRTCLAVFGGVLPEQDVRLAVAQLRGISSSNDFRLLEALGGDCAGALQFLPDDTPPVFVPSTPRRIDDEELHRILVDLPRRPLAMGERDGARLSLAGAQAKLPVLVDDQGLSLATGDEPPTTHIIKPEPVRFPGLVANESTCMQLARQLGLLVAHAEVRATAGGIAYLLVRRYDRVRTGNVVTRLHQEDLCQALARLPSEKYQAEGGPSFAEAMALLSTTSAAPALDRPRMWDALVLNFLIGNCDAHGKNFSLLASANRPSLAPLYDLVATTVYPELSTRLAMSIGGATHIDDVDRSAFETAAIDSGLNQRAAVIRARELATRAVSVVRQLVEHSSADAQDVASAIGDGIAERSRKLR